jgi:hypothetical protein
MKTMSRATWILCFVTRARTFYPLIRILYFYGYCKRIVEETIPKYNVIAVPSVIENSCKRFVVGIMFYTMVYACTFIAYVSLQFYFSIIVSGSCSHLPTCVLTTLVSQSQPYLFLILGTCTFCFELKGVASNHTMMYTLNKAHFASGF